MATTFRPGGNLAGRIASGRRTSAPRPVQSYRLPSGKVIQSDLDLGSLMPVASVRDLVAASTPPPAPPPPPNNVGLMGDLASSFGQGAVGGLKNIADIFGADNPVSSGLDSVSGYLRDRVSPERKAELELQEREKAALGPDASMLDRAGLFARQAIRNPGTTIAEGIGNIVPLMAASALAPEALGARALTMGTGAAMGVGAVKGGIYDTTYQGLLNQGVPEDQARARASQAQSYAENPGLIAAGAVEGTIAARFGADEAIAGMVNMPAAMARATLKEEARKATLLGALRGAAHEVLTEGPQESLETYLGNRGAIGAGVNMDQNQGVLEAGVKAAIMSAVPGAGATYVSGRRAKAQLDGLGPEVPALEGEWSHPVAATGPRQIGGRTSPILSLLGETAGAAPRALPPGTYNMPGKREFVMPGARQMAEPDPGEEAVLRDAMLREDIPGLDRIEALAAQEPASAPPTSVLDLVNQGTATQRQRAAKEAQARADAAAEAEARALAEARQRITAPERQAVPGGPLVVPETIEKRDAQIPIKLSGREAAKDPRAQKIAERVGFEKAAKALIDSGLMVSNNQARIAAELIFGVPQKKNTLGSILRRAATAQGGEWNRAQEPLALPEARPDQPAIDTAVPAPAEIPVTAPPATAIAAPKPPSRQKIAADARKAKIAEEQRIAAEAEARKQADIEARRAEEAATAAAAKQKIDALDWDARAAVDADAEKVKADLAPFVGDRGKRRQTLHDAVLQNSGGVAWSDIAGRTGVKAKEIPQRLRSILRKRGNVANDLAATFEDMGQEWGIRSLDEFVERLMSQEPTFHPNDQSGGSFVAKDVAAEAGLTPKQAHDALVQDKNNPRELAIKKVLAEKDPFDSQEQLDRQRDERARAAAQMSDATEPEEGDASFDPASFDEPAPTVPADEPAESAEPSFLRPQKAHKAEAPRKAVNVQKTKAGQQILLPGAAEVMDTSSRVGQLKAGQEDVNRAPLFTQEEEAAKKADAARQTSIVDVAATEAAKPTEARADAGNYKKGHVRLGGLDISIENEAGSKRRPEWPALNAHYGYVKGTEGKDGDHLDVFIKPGTPHNYDGPVFVVNQTNAKGGFDEHKAMIGWPNEEAALAAYKENYTPGWDRFTGLGDYADMGEFKRWIENADLTKPAPLSYESKKRVADASKPVRAAARSAAPQAATRLEDAGEKIGGARKDLATPTGPKRAAIDDGRPGWAKKFNILEGVPGTGKKWAIAKKDDDQRSRFGGRILAECDTREEAERMLPVIAVAEKHSVVMERGNGDKFIITRKIGDRKRVQVVEQKFDTREAGMEYLAQHAKDIIELKTNFGEEALPRPDPNNVRRIGAARRAGDITTSQQFVDAFGVRGVEFGKWEASDERQTVVNHAYDSLLDLAETLGIPPRAIGLNGELGIAFGARGHGLEGARAHYETDYGAINLTKMKGAGALAHEWFHALDHHFARLDGKALSTRVQNERGDMVFPTKDSAWAATQGFRYNSKLRAEIRDKLQALVSTMNHKAEKYVEDTKQVEKWVGQTRGDVKYRLDQVRLYIRDPLTYKKTKNKAATPQQLARFDALADELINAESITLQHTGITATKRPGGRLGMNAGYWTNAAVNEISAMLQEIRGSSGFAKDTGILRHLTDSLHLLETRLKMVSEAKAGNEKIKTTLTEFARNANSADLGRAGDYWSTPPEMAARAFQSYVEDRLSDRAAVNDFLTFGTKNAAIPTPWGMVRPYPLGEERAALNAVFDDLFKTIESRETPKGVELYAVDDEAHGVPRFAIAKGTQQNYEKRIDELFAGAQVSRHGTKILDRSDVLALLGHGSLPVFLHEGKLVQGLRNHPEVSASVWKKIPGWLENPAAVVQSDTEQGRLVVFAPELVDGKPMALVLEPDARHAGLSVHLLLTAYAKGHPNWRRWSEEGLFEYVDHRTLPRLLVTSGLYVAGVKQEARKMGRLLRHEGDLVKWRSENQAPLMAGDAATPADARVSSPLAIEQVRRAIPGLNWKPHPEGGFVARLRNGRDLRVLPDATFENIDPEAMSVSAAANPIAGGTGRPRGSYSPAQSLIKIATGAKLTTLDHEGLHMLWDLALSPAEKDALMRKFGGEEQAAYAYEWVTEPAPMTWWGKAFQKVRDLARRIVHYFRPTWESTFAEARSGRAGARVTGEGTTTGQRAAAKESFRPGDPQREDNFRRWFGDSKVVDENGKPLVVYHGTEKSFTTFKSRSAAGWGEGIYFSDKPTDAQEFSDGPGGNVIPAYVKIENPYYGDEIDTDAIESTDAWKSRAEFETLDPWSLFEEDGGFAGEVIRELGFDGIISDRSNGMEGREIVAFRPEQIKSAAGNDGNFDPNNPDIRYATDDAEPDETQEFTPPEETFLQRAEHLIRNSLNRVGVVASAWEKQTGKKTAVDFEESFGGIQPRARAAVEDAEVAFAKPITSFIARHKLDFDLLGRFAMAIHAPAADKALTEEALVAAAARKLVKLRAEDPTALSHIDPEGITVDIAEEILGKRRVATIRAKNPSGMSPERVAEIRARVAATGKAAAYEEARQMILGVQDATNALRVKKGLASQEQVDRWREKYGPDFVHLWNDDADIIDRFMRKGSRGYGVKGAEVQRRRGRKSEAAAHPLISAVQDLERTILRAEKMTSLDGFARWVEENPELGTVREGEPDKDGVGFKRGGRQYSLDLADPILKDQFQKLTTPQIDVLTQTLGSFTRMFSRINTVLSPPFVLKNSARDYSGAVLSSIILHGAKGGPTGSIAAKVATSQAAAIKGVYRYMKDPAKAHPAGSWEQAVGEALRHGAIPGYFNAIESMAEIRSKLEAAVKDGMSKSEAFRLGMTEAQAAWADPKLSMTEKVARSSSIAWDSTMRGIGARKAFDILMDLNKGAEIATRVNYFKALRDGGMSAPEAAAKARNLTDFNKRGEYTTMANAVWSFFNANVQGTTRLAEMVTAADPKVRARAIATMAGLFGAGFLWNTMIGALAGDDDDDGIPDSDQMPDWADERNLIIPAMGNLSPILIPLAQGFNVPFFAGIIASKLLNGRMKKADAAVAIVAAAANSYNPIGTLYGAPTAIQPGIEVLGNKDWAGRPVTPTRFPGQEGLPDSQLAFRTTSAMAKRVAAGLNRATGGDESVPGYVDVSPATLDHFVRYFGGGAGRFMQDAVDAVVSMAKGEEPGRVPFASSFLVDTNRAYESRYWDQLRSLDILENQVKSKERVLRAETLAEAAPNVDVGRIGLADLRKATAGLPVSQERTAWMQKALRDLDARRLVLKPVFDAAGKAITKLKAQPSTPERDAQLENIYLRLNREWTRVTGGMQ